VTPEVIRRRLGLLLVAALLASSCSPAGVRMGMAKGDGARLAYRAVGHGEPLVVIHDGPGGEKSIMYGGFDGLSETMRVVYYDQRGCGRSEPLTASQSCTIEDNVRDLEALRAYLHLDRFSIAAHGWGAVIAIEYARAHPERVEALVLVTPVSPYSPGLHLDGLIERLPPEGRDRVEAVMENPFSTMLETREQFVRAVLPMLFYNDRARREADLEDYKYSADVDARLSSELKSFDLYERLAGVETPTLVIAGRHDVLTPLAEQMAYVDGISTSRAVVFNDSAHFPFLEERRTFLSQVGGFISQGAVPPLAKGPASH